MSPIACKTWDGSTAPEVQAEPVPSITSGRLKSNASASMSGNVRLLVQDCISLEGNLPRPHIEAEAYPSDLGNAVRAGGKDVMVVTVGWIEQTRQFFMPESVPRPMKKPFSGQVDTPIVALIRNDITHAASWILRITAVARHQVDMHMWHSLSGSRANVDAQVEAVRVKAFNE